VGRFLGVWLPSFLTIVALSLVMFGLNWWIAGTPGGGARLGVVVGVANIVSVVVVAALSGTLDRVHRGRSTLVILLAAAGCVAGAGLVFLNGPTFPLLALATVCYVAVEVLYAAYSAVMETMNADLAPRRWASERTATLIQSQPQVERIAVPAAGGALIAAGALFALSIVGVVLIGVVLVTLSFTHRYFTAASRESASGGWLRSVRRDFLSSLALIRRDRELVFLLVLGVLGNVVVFPFYTLLPAYLSHYGLAAREHAAWYGRAGLAYGLGLLVGSLLMVRVRKQGNRIGRAAGALAVICAALLATTVVAAPAVLVVSMALVGVLIVVMVGTAGALWLYRTPAEVRVRVFSVRRLIIFSSIPLGTSLLGFGGTALGYPLFLRIHLVCVLVLLAVAWTVRVLRRKPGRVDQHLERLGVGAQPLEATPDDVGERHDGRAQRQHVDGPATEQRDR
jgi:hypothetical protein